MEDDTVKLLRECDAGIRMGIDSINGVLDYSGAEGLRATLRASRDEHQALAEELRRQLDAAHDDGKVPGMMARGMSWLKTNVSLAVNESDRTIADLITDGCDMGVKSLCRYLNQYPAANGHSRDITRRLISVEERLGKDMRPYL